MEMAMEMAMMSTSATASMWRRHGRRNFHGMQGGGGKEDMHGLYLMYLEMGTQKGTGDRGVGHSILYVDGGHAM
jgi:hypothetical protein